MFLNSYNLKNVDLSNFDTSTITNMSGMFRGCGFTELDFSQFKYWNTSNVTNMNSMFYGCQSLTTLDLTSFDTANVEEMKEMFNQSYNLQILDISSFDTRKVTNMDAMFSNNYELTTIYVGSNWSTDLVESSTNMFAACRKLVGAIPFDGLYTDKTYANIDGYLTLKT